MHSTDTPEALLDAANKASEKVAALHVAFVALCSYVLMIAFNTIDVDLLFGKNINLSVVNVEVPIVNFYATAPFLLLFIHFNLLVALLLLSRKLFAFDDIAPTDKAAAGLRYQLSIFPYNHYLVGSANRLVQGFVAAFVTMTILVLPLLALVTLQARFLGYQSEAVAWVQRSATWLDVLLVATLWPAIMNRLASWTGYVRAVWQHAKYHWIRWCWGVLAVASLIVVLVGGGPLYHEEYVAKSVELEPGHYTDVTYYKFVPSVYAYRDLGILAPLAAGVLVVSVLALMWRRGVRPLSGGQHFAVLRERPPPPVLGMLGLLFVLSLGLSTPLVLVVDGEHIDRPDALATQSLDSLRHLDLHGIALIASHPEPKTVDGLTGPNTVRTTALENIEGIDLRGRLLRGANFFESAMPKADLSGAQLERADLRFTDLGRAVLYRAGLRDARLVGAVLEEAHLDEAMLAGADLSGANLRRADLSGAVLHGVDLKFADLRGADMSGAQIQGAFLYRTDLRAARLVAASLAGASLVEVFLQGADLTGADLNYADLQGAVLYTKYRSRAARLGSPTVANWHFVDLRQAKWQPIDARGAKELRDARLFEEWAATPGLDVLVVATCLRDGNTQIGCEQHYSLSEYRAELQPRLVALACTSPDIAHGILRRYWGVPVPGETRGNEVMTGFKMRLEAKRKEPNSASACPGLAQLSAQDRDSLTR